MHIFLVLGVCSSRTVFSSVYCNARCIFVLLTIVEAQLYTTLLCNTIIEAVSMQKKTIWSAVLSPRKGQLLITRLMDILNCWLQIVRRILKCPTHDSVRSIAGDVDLSREIMGVIASFFIIVPHLSSQINKICINWITVMKVGTGHKNYINRYGLRIFQQIPNMLISLRPGVLWFVATFALLQIQDGSISKRKECHILGFLVGRSDMFYIPQGNSQSWYGFGRSDEGNTFSYSVRTLVCCQ